LMLAMTLPSSFRGCSREIIHPADEFRNSAAVVGFLR
jgi:hypothetical protein